MIKSVLLRGLTVLVAFSFVTIGHGRAIDRTIAKINSTILTESDLAEVVATANGAYRSTNVDAFAEATSETVISMLDKALLLQEAKRLQITPGGQELNREVEEMVREIQANFPSEAVFHQTLAAERLSLSQLKEQLLKQTREDYMVYHVVNSQFSVSDADLEKMKAEGGVSRAARYRLHRLGVEIKPDRNANAACRRARELVSMSITDGVSFEEGVRRYSEVPGAGDDGGDMGFVELDKLSTEVRQAVENLEVGQASAPVIAGAYANVFYVAGKRNERVALREQKFITARADLLKSLRRRAVLHVYDDRLTPLLSAEYRPQVVSAVTAPGNTPGSVTNQQVSQTPLAGQSQRTETLLYSQQATPVAATHQAPSPHQAEPQPPHQPAGYPHQYRPAAAYTPQPAQQTPARRSFWGNFRRNQP